MKWGLPLTFSNPERQPGYEICKMDMPHGTGDICLGRLKKHVVQHQTASVNLDMPHFCSVFEILNKGCMALSARNDILKPPAPVHPMTPFRQEPTADPIHFL
jgi:hypothetical protein